MRSLIALVAAFCGLAAALSTVHATPAVSDAKAVAVDQSSSIQSRRPLPVAQ